MTRHSGGPHKPFDRLAERLAEAKTLDAVLDVLLDAAIKLTRAQFGNIQLYRGGMLVIAVQRGFDKAFLDRFRRVSIADNSACGRALREGRTVIIENVETDREFTELRPAAAAAGFSAVQSTPLVSSEGHFIGILSTHFARPRSPSKAEQSLTNAYASVAADALWPFVQGDDGALKP